MVPRSKPPLTVRVCGCTGRQKEAMKLFEGSVKMAEAKLRSVEKKVKVELGQMRAAAHRSDAVFQQKLQPRRLLRLRCQLRWMGIFVFRAALGVFLHNEVTSFPVPCCVPRRTC